MTRWHSITIVDGAKKLHTFDYVPRFEDQNQNLPNPRLAWHHRAVLNGNPDLADVGRKQLDLWRPGMSLAEYFRRSAAVAGYRRYMPNTLNHVPLEDIPGRLDVAKGFNPTGTTLAFALDALRRHDIGLPEPRHTSTVQLAALNTVVSEYGGRIGQLDGLAPDARRRAEAALYKLVAAQCATM